MERRREERKRGKTREVDVEKFPWAWVAWIGCGLGLRVEDAHCKIQRERRRGTGRCGVLIGGGGSDNGRQTVTVTSRGKKNWLPWSPEVRRSN